MKITDRGQVTIPIDIRKRMGLLPNSDVEFVVSRGQVVLKKARNRRRRGARLISAMKGKASRKLSTDEIMDLTRGE